jgi:hypothetical protein
LPCLGQLKMYQEAIELMEKSTQIKKASTYYLAFLICILAGDEPNGKKFANIVY